MKKNYKILKTRNSLKVVQILMVLSWFSLTNKIHWKIDEKIVNKEEAPYTKYITNYYIYSGGSVLYTWIKNGKQESLEEIASLLFNLTTILLF